MITCSFVIPTPLQEILPPEAIWNHDIKFVTGQTYQIIAPSGRGKSTLIGLLAGLRGDYSGQIHINNRNIQQFTTQDWANWRATGASFVFQDLRLFPNLTALQNIQLAQNISQPIATIHAIEQWADQLQIKHKLMQPCGELSFGQYSELPSCAHWPSPFNGSCSMNPFLTSTPTTPSLLGN
jgi:ABC-type lipoprotein export system ATPase subunit